MVLCCEIGVYCFNAKIKYSAMLMCCVETFVVTAKVHILQWQCVVCGVHWGQSNSRYSAMVLY